MPFSLAPANHPYHQMNVAFSTMHGKESLLQPLFEEAFSAELTVPTVDTDQFGTFSGEVKRPSEIKQVLVAKALEGMRRSGLRFGLASEGSFGPHPHLPFLECNQESLVFLDALRDISIFAHHISLDNRSYHSKLNHQQDLEKFLATIDLGSQAVILKPGFEFSGPTNHIFKGLQETPVIFSAFEQLKEWYPEQALWIETDNRAHMSKARRKVISECGLQLIEKLKSLCPDCQTPGFEMTGFNRGLPCRGCGLASENAKEEIWSCPNKNCAFSQIKPRKDGLTEIEERDCSYCNP